MIRIYTTVPTRHCALAFRAGRLRRTLPAGFHWIAPGTRLVRLDLRERQVTLAPQEIPLADGLNVRVTCAVTYRIADPAAYHLVSTDPDASLYLAVQIGLRDALSAQSIESVLGAARAATELAVTVRADVQEQVARVGIEVLALVVKDLLLPAEIRSAAAAVVTARQRGLAELEKARAQTAALRSLANAATLLDKHPALAQLRLVEAAPAGSTVVLRIGDGPEETRPPR